MVRRKPSKERSDQLARADRERYANERRPPLRQSLLDTFHVAPPRNRARSNSPDSGRANRRRAAEDGRLEADAVVHRRNEMVLAVHGDDAM